MYAQQKIDVKKYDDHMLLMFRAFTPVIFYPLSVCKLICEQQLIQLFM